MSLSKNQMIVSWILQIIVIAMMIYAAVPKLMGAEESVAMFNALPGQDMLRYLTGALEIIGAVLLIIPGTVVYGALLVILVMIGAFGSHVMYLGFEGDAGMFAGMAIGLLIISAVIVYMRRKSLPFLS